MFTFLCSAYFSEHNVLPLLPHAVNDGLSFFEVCFSLQGKHLLFICILDGLRLVLRLDCCVPSCSKHGSTRHANFIAFGFSLV